MAKPLLSVAPENMAEDEQQIAKGYRKGWKTSLVAAATIFAVAYFEETKWVLAVGFVFVVAVLNEAEGRLYDLCIRLRRTNSLLNETRVPPTF